MRDTGSLAGLRPQLDDGPAALGEIVFGSDDIAHTIEDIARRVRADYAGQPLLLVGILKGALIFTADLMRALGDYPLSVDFMVVTSYGTGRKGGSDVRLLKDLDFDPARRHVLLVEDIVDEGYTLEYLLNNLKSRNPLSLRSCALIDKPFHRKVDIKPDYVGLVAPDAFLVGYGLDYEERHRNLPYICKLRSPSLRNMM